MGWVSGTIEFHQSRKPSNSNVPCGTFIFRSVRSIFNLISQDNHLTVMFHMEHLISK